MALSVRLTHSYTIVLSHQCEAHSHLSYHCVAIDSMVEQQWPRIVLIFGWSPQLSAWFVVVKSGGRWRPFDSFYQYWWLGGGGLANSLGGVSCKPLCVPWVLKLPKQQADSSLSFTNVLFYKFTALWLAKNWAASTDKSTQINKRRCYQWLLLLYSKKVRHFVQWDLRCLEKSPP